MKYCIHCGKQIEEDSLFCEFCGGSQKEESSPAPRPEPEPPVPEPEPKKPRQKKVRKKKGKLAGIVTTAAIAVGVFVLTSIFPIGGDPADEPPAGPAGFPSAPPGQEQPAKPDGPQTDAPPQDDYIVVEHPAFSDFDWYHNAVSSGNMPEGAEYFTAYGDITGPWKCMIVYYENGTESPATGRELLDVTISGDIHEAVLTMVPYQMEWGGELVDEQDTPELTYTGGLDEEMDTIMLSYEGSSLYLDSTFCTTGEQQYGFGFMMTASDIYADVLFTRP